VEPAESEQRAALEARIAEEPEDPVAWQVYADFLQRLDDPTGELIALQLAAAKDPVGKARTPAQRAFTKAFTKYAPRLLGSLIDHGGSTKDPSAPPMIWRNGVLRRVELGATPSHLDPIGHRPQPQATHLAALLPHPAASMLGEVAIRCPDQADAASALSLLVAFRPRLVELELFARGELGDLSELWDALPNLRRVTLGTHTFELGELELPRARRVELLPLTLSPSSMRAIAAAPWPVLERLEVRFGGADLPPHAAMRDLAPLLARNDMPALTTLKLRGSPYAGAILRAIADGPLAGQLELLDLSGGNYNPHDLAYVAERKQRFTKLRELWMASTHSTLRSAVGLLAGVAKHVVTRFVPDRLGPELGPIDPRVLDRYREPPEGE
jgi:uncharacterized protein (TIGR02996 family)